MYLREAAQCENTVRILLEVDGFPGLGIATATTKTTYSPLTGPTEAARPYSANIRLFFILFSLPTACLGLGCSLFGLGRPPPPSLLNPRLACLYYPYQNCCCLLLLLPTATVVNWSNNLPFPFPTLVNQSIHLPPSPSSLIIQRPQGSI
ncbi:hypothetical protein F4779DRAFT_174837 [Xylariaceae sp. FL0662B]|nr:hypothetical protein F4779DRAFT_174837 [Xylariaceae sp. FL0662B]